jgi:hypothetical protein
MAKKFSELRNKMSPEAHARATARAREMMAEMPLNELRAARRMSQEQLAVVLRTKQGSVSKLEHRADMYISTLRSYVEAMGGQLDIVARFPDGSVKIKKFEDLDADANHV